MADCLIGLGSNVGDRAQHLDDCVTQFCGHPQVHRQQLSRYHTTTPVGGPAGQGSFLNAALRVTTDLDPQALLSMGQRSGARCRATAPRALGTTCDRYRFAVVRPAGVGNTRPDCATSANGGTPICLGSSRRNRLGHDSCTDTTDALSPAGATERTSTVHGNCWSAACAARTIGAGSRRATWSASSACRHGRGREP